MKIPMQVIRDAIETGIATLDDSKPKEQQLAALAQGVIDALGAAGMTLIETDVLWDFDDQLNWWLNDDGEAGRLSDFTPLNYWGSILHRMPRRK